MYGYLVSSLIIFLTHPGILVNFFDPGVFGALFQTLIVFILQLPSDSKPGFSYTMSIIYWVVLAAWAYFKVRTTMAMAAIK